MDHRRGVALGILEVSSTQIGIKLDVTEATKLPVEGGSSLPNGISIPMILPNDVIPLAIQIPNTKAKVYLAVSKQKILAGVALSLGSLGGTAGDVLKLPMNIFFPFQISPTLSGNAGFFTGDVQGLAIFALQDLPSKPVATPTGISLRGSSASLASRSVEAEPKEVWLMKRSKVSSSRMFRLYNAISELEEVEIQ
jgi:hypothetical protein